MPQQVSFKKRWQYWFDNQFSKGTGALIRWLGVLSAALILLMALVISALGVRPEGGDRLGFAEAAWQSLMRTLDAGTMGGDTGWGFRVAMFLVTLAGVFIISTLIGILTSAVEAKLDDLRKGRSEVVEQDHTVILGWSEAVFPIIGELVQANANLRDACIVVLGEEDKVAMEEEIATQVGDTGRTRVVCRSGRPMDLADLRLVSLNSARSVIVLASKGTDPDTETIKTVLAIVNHPDRRAEPYHVVAQIEDPKNLEAARIIGREEVKWVLAGSFISRIIAQTCRQSGLSSVYTELLDFGGDEMYTRVIPEAVGRTYGEALALFEKNAVMGIVRGGQAELNPVMDTLLGAEDALILIAADDDQVRVDGIPEGRVATARIALSASREAPEQALLLGWNRGGTELLQSLDAYMPKGSKVTVVSSDPDARDAFRAGGGRKLMHTAVSFQEADPTRRHVLDSLPLAKTDHVIVLCSDRLEVQQADAQALITLVHLRDIAEKGGLRYSIVSEMLDIRDRDLADVTRADDFIVSDKLVSLLMAQISENAHLASVFEDLFDPEGSEVYLKPLEHYLKLDGPVNFYTLLEAARRRGETAIGYRLQSEARSSAQAYGVHLNPAKSQEVVFQPGDRVVLVARD